MSLPVGIHAEDHAGRRLPVQLLRDQRELHKDQTREGVLLPRGQNVSMPRVPGGCNFATHFSPPKHFSARARA